LEKGAYIRHYDDENTVTLQKRHARIFPMVESARRARKNMQNNSNGDYINAKIIEVRYER